MSRETFDSFDALLYRIDPILRSQAWAMAQTCMYLYGVCLDDQDIVQEGRIYLWRYWSRRPDTPLLLLLTLARLRLYGERTRGRSVLRPHPGKRTRIYERATLSQANILSVQELDPHPEFTIEQEEQLLISFLQRAQHASDEAEHEALLLVRRFAKATENERLYREMQQQWRDWWQRHRERAEETTHE